MKKKFDKKKLLTAFWLFLLAIAFWLIIKINKEYDYAVDIPLRITINNPAICLKYPTHDSVRVQFAGRGTDLLQLQFSDVSYDIDLSDEKRDFVMNLTDMMEYVRIPVEVNVEARAIIRPHEIAFELDERVVRKVPLRVRSQVGTRPGFTLVAARPTPDSVTVSGPRIFLDTLQAVNTGHKAFTAVDLAFRETLPIVKDSRFYAQYEPQKASVYFDIQRLGEREIENVPVTIINAADNLEVVPLPSSVTIYAKGGEKVLAEAKPGDFSVVIDFARDWKPGAKKVPATVVSDLPVLEVRSRPAVFDLIVQRKRR